MKNMTGKVVIAGAGQAGAMAARELRQFGFSGEITLFGQESHLPYERPELSKGYLSGAISFDQMRIFSPAKLAELGITVRPSESVVRINPDQASVRTSSGLDVGYDHLIIATGGAARRLEGCCALRSRADADEIKEQLSQARSLGVIGAGWLGLELAAHGRALGLETTVYEMADSVCARVLPTDVSKHLEAYHVGSGVKFEMGKAPDIANVCAQNDVTVACIGMSANDAIARDAGLETDRGILVDDRQRSSVPSIYAIGDCARQKNSAPVESWAYANRSAKRAAADITGAQIGAEEPLWFWSKQGALSLQMIGACAADLTVTVEEVAQKGKVWRYEDQAKLKGLIAINSPRDFAKARRLFV